MGVLGCEDVKVRGNPTTFSSFSLLYALPSSHLPPTPSTGSVRSLCYDNERRILFTGGFDQIIVVWDIGSQKGTAYELTGHR